MQMTCNADRSDDFPVLGDSEEQDISLIQPSGTKLPTIHMTVLLNESKTCPKCEHLLRNGLQARINIHSTLAYSRCKCHRDWKYENLSRLQQTEGETAGFSSSPRMISRFVQSSSSGTSRCSSAFPTKRMNSFQQATFFNPRELRRGRPTLKTKEMVESTIIDKDNKSLESSKSASLGFAAISDKRVAKEESNSTPKLPQIFPNKISTNKHPFSKQLARSKGPPKQFEFIHLLKYLPSSLKQVATEFFMKLDLDGDGHLAYAEVLEGLGRNFDEMSKDVLKMYLKPIYHTLGDATYFGKRDFILCYSMVRLLHEHKLPKLYHPQSVEFYIKTVKPLLSLMHRSATEEGTIPIFVIESLVEEYCQKSGCRVVFRKFKVTNLIEGDGLLSLINAFILAPYLFETV